MITTEELKRRHIMHHPTSHFFDSSTLRFFGERFSEMRVLKTIAKVEDYSGEVHECYILSSLQRNAPGGPRRKYHYFDVNNYSII